jgi:hypothetical protein
MLRKREPNAYITTAILTLKMLLEKKSICYSALDIKLFAKEQL